MIISAANRMAAVGIDLSKSFITLKIQGNCHTQTKIKR